MVNPGAFEGSRKLFLLSQKPAYEIAKAGGYENDALSVIQRKYFKRYPVDLPHNVEPSEEHLASVDDDTADIEPEEPDESKLTSEEFKLAMERMQTRGKVIRYRKAQIQRWFHYQYGKDHGKNIKSTAENPYVALTQRLSGTENTKPRLKTPVNMWRKSHRDSIERELLAMEPPVDRKNIAKTREAIARRMFLALDVGEQRKWKRAALDEHTEAMAEFNTETESPEASTDPADRQRAIQGLVRFMQPILDSICKITGWKATLLAGGPEPAQGGFMSIMSMHSGTTTGDVKMNFGRAERHHFQSALVPMYGSFLHKCYTSEECKSRALPKDNEFTPMSLSPEYDDDMVTITSIAPPSMLSSTSSIPLVSSAAISTAAVPTPVHSYSTGTSAVADNSNPFPYNSMYQMSEDGSKSPTRSPQGDTSAPNSPRYSAPPPSPMGTPSPSSPSALAAIAIAARQPLSNPSVGTAFIASTSAIYLATNAGTVPTLAPCSATSLEAVASIGPTFALRSAANFSSASVALTTNPCSAVASNVQMHHTPAAITPTTTTLAGHCSVSTAIAREVITRVITPSPLTPVAPSTVHLAGVNTCVGHADSVMDQPPAPVASAAAKQQGRKRKADINSSGTTATHLKPKRPNVSTTTPAAAKKRTTRSAVKEAVPSAGPSADGTATEDTVILRSGKPAKPSKFWVYKEVNEG